MSNDVFAFPVREWVRGEVPAERRRKNLLVPRAHEPPRDGEGPQNSHQVLICHDPKLTLSKFRRAEAVVGKTGDTCVASRSCVLVGDSMRRRLRVPTPLE
jgi:hypothetical protein